MVSGFDYSSFDPRWGGERVDVVVAESKIETTPVIAWLPYGEDRDLILGSYVHCLETGNWEALALRVDVVHVDGQQYNVSALRELLRHVLQSVRGHCFTTWFPNSPLLAGTNTAIAKVD